MALKTSDAVKEGLRSIAGFLTALAAAATALPLPVFYAHHHLGGEHGHVHAAQPWRRAHTDADAGAHAHSHDGGGTHVHSHATPPMLEGAAERDHVHWQHPFQSVAASRATAVVVVEAIREAPSRRLESPAPRTLPAPRSRGPPLSTFL